MPLWTVHSKAGSRGEMRARAQDVRFVREGFNWPAFLVPLIWLVVKGMWIVLLLALAIEVALIALGAWFGLSDSVLTILGIGVNLVMGFAGNDLYRWTLARGGWREMGLAAGSDLDVAELRFFTALGADSPLSAPTAVLPASVPSMPDALGLFPQSGSPR